MYEQLADAHIYKSNRQRWRPYLGTVAVEAVLRVASRSACVDADVEIGRCAAQSGRQVDAIGVGVVALREDDAVEGFIEFDEDFHQILFAFDVQGDDAWHILDWSRPGIRWSRLGWQGNCCFRSAVLLDLLSRFG